MKDNALSGLILLPDALGMGARSSLALIPDHAYPEVKSPSKVDGPFILT